MTTDRGRIVLMPVRPSRVRRRPRQAGRTGHFRRRRRRRRHLGAPELSGGSPTANCSESQNRRLPHLIPGAPRSPRVAPQAFERRVSEMAPMFTIRAPPSDTCPPRKQAGQAQGWRTYGGGPSSPNSYPPGSAIAAAAHLCYYVAVSQLSAIHYQRSTMKHPCSILSRPVPPQIRRVEHPVFHFPAECSTGQIQTEHNGTVWNTSHGRRSPLA